MSDEELLEEADEFDDDLGTPKKKGGEEGSDEEEETYADFEGDDNWEM